MELNLKSIKTENVKSVALCFSPGRMVSRAEISAKTGLSLVTVGKIADALISRGVLLEEKKVGQGAGRRAGWLMINPDKILITVETCKTNAVIKLRRLNLDLLEKHNVDAADIKEFDEKLTDALAEVSMMVLQSYGADACLGVVVMTDSVSDRAKYSSLVGSFFPDMIVCADSAVNLSAMFASYGSPPDDIVLFVSVGNEAVHGAFVSNHKLIMRRDGRSVNFGDTLFPDGERFIDKLRHAPDKDKYVSLIVDCICNTARIILPDSVSIEIENDCYFDGIEEKIKSSVAETLGFETGTTLSIALADHENGSAYGGAMLTVCSRWLESFTLEN